MDGSDRVRNRRTVWKEALNLGKAFLSMAWKSQRFLTKWEEMLMYYNEYQHLRASLSKRGFVHCAVRDVEHDMQAHSWLLDIEQTNEFIMYGMVCDELGRKPTAWGFVDFVRCNPVLYKGEVMMTFMTFKDALGLRKRFEFMQKRINSLKTSQDQCLKLLNQLGYDTSDIAGQYKADMEEWRAMNTLIEYVGRRHLAGFSFSGRGNLGSKSLFNAIDNVRINRATGAEQRAEAGSSE